MDLLGLSEEELCTTLDTDPLTLLSGQLDHRPELRILLALLAEAEDRAGKAVLRRWVRATGPNGDQWTTWSPATSKRSRPTSTS
jgi:hypothetical protein